MGGYIGSKSSVTQVDGYNKTEADAEFVNDPNDAITVDGSGNVGIGTSSPSDTLDVATSTNGTPVRVRLTANDTGGVTRNGTVFFDADTNTVGFRNGGADRVHVDSSGNLLVGKTSSDASVSGMQLDQSGEMILTRTGGCFIANRIGSNGGLLTFRRDGSTVGSIGVDANDNLYICSTATNHGGIYMNDSGVLPMSAGALSDNTRDLGNPSYRWDDVYATNGTIQTSDANEKQQIAALTTAEMTAAKAISEGFKTFKWNDSVAEKGAAAARTHSGVIAQEVEQAMTDAGLDAGDYAFFISSTWWETQTDVPAVEADEENGVEAKEAYTRTDTYDTLEEAPQGAKERNRKGIRYPQLLSFVGAATEQRLASIEARLTALEVTP